MSESQEEKSLGTRVSIIIHVHEWRPTLDVKGGGGGGGGGGGRSVAYYYTFPQ